MCKPKADKPSTTNTNNNYVKDALDAHNTYRGVHQAGKLKLNNELNTIAQQWAETIAKTNNFEHSNNNYLGQSLG
jgi:uncharacterized protein YkwD